MTQQHTQPPPQTRTSASSQTKVQALARYAARASFDELSPASREQLPVHILDSLGFCIAALERHERAVSGPSRCAGPTASG
jgi:2-methylcitrate dehydratase